MLILAPMYDVTDVVFRQMVAACAPPDMFMTEFVNVDGLQSAGRERLLHFLKREDTHDVPVIAQIWGKNPDNFYKTARELANMGFDGIDLNTGCPDKTITKNGCCSAFIKPENRPLFKDILQATKNGAGDLPVSVKTRLGWGQTDFTWHQMVLEQGTTMFSIHGRTRKEMSKVPVRWYEIAHIRSMRDDIAPETKIIGNGDVMTVEQAHELQEEHQLDGIMIGRGVFQDPYLFAGDASIWANKTVAEKVDLFIKHLELYRDTYAVGERKYDPVKKFMKVYLSGFEGAADLRLQIATTKAPDEAITILERYKDSK
ncbi:MAG: tRNA-dihydrouridine synthase [Patescibacteria group bacterium]